MARRSRKRSAGSPGGDSGTSEYRDSEGNALTLRNGLSSATLRKLSDLDRKPGASADDLWQRRSELVFERLVVAWTIADLPLTGQKELLGRYRMADSETRRWIARTISDHMRRHQPEAGI